MGAQRGGMFDHPDALEKLHALYHEAQTARLLRREEPTTITFRVGSWRLTVSHGPRRAA